MHLLAESGGTKTQWYLYNQDGLQKSIRTSGMNPNTATAEAIAAQQREEWGADLPPGEGLTLDFYGAGLGAPATEATMRAILGGLFPHATIRIESDMLAAARAACGGQPGIVCILGTGSNCCFWDGQKITANLGSHGYLFNDEGSGARTVSAGCAARKKTCGTPPSSVRAAARKAALPSSPSENLR